MSGKLTDLQLLHELEPFVEKYLNRHLSMHKPWNPHDYIPWSDGKNFYALGGQDWVPEQSQLSDLAQVAMVQNLMTEDNLPSYHREIAMNFGLDGPWGTWVNRWTAEENRHGIALRDYLVVTRAVDPGELEKLRLEVLGERVRQKMETAPDKKVYLQGDGSVPYQDIYDVIDRLKDAGVTDIALVARAPGQK